jgi:effector-binding domain-containing protein
MLILAVAATYVFIPGKINIANVSLVKCTLNKVNACLRSPDRWAQWWPNYNMEDKKTDSIFTYRGFEYKLTEPLSNGANIQLAGKNISVESNIFLLSIGKDSTAIQWRTSFTASLNPVKRFLQYFRAVTIKKNMNAVLEKLHDYADKTENIYGLSIRTEKVKFEFLVSVKKSLPAYPGTATIYEMVDELKRFVAEKGAKVEGAPMLSVINSGDFRYDTELAIPVDKKMEGEGDISFKWMLKGGNILVAETKGGTALIDQSMLRFKEFVSDHQYTVMAIPFQLMVTDRRQEKDSSKWITQLYYPVM